MRPTQFRFQVLGKDWILRLMKRKRYDQKNGSDSVAITTMHKRRIDLGPDGRDLETIVHELVHAYLYELCLRSTNDLSVDDLEEIFAELMAKRGRELLDLADSLFSRIHSPIDAP
jgi:hypothetical protein